MVGAKAGAKVGAKKRFVYHYGAAGHGSRGVRVPLLSLTLCPSGFLART